MPGFLMALQISAMAVTGGSQAGWVHARGVRRSGVKSVASPDSMFHFVLPDGTFAAGGRLPHPRGLHGAG